MKRSIKLVGLLFFVFLLTILVPVNTADAATYSTQITLRLIKGIDGNWHIIEKKSGDSVFDFDENYIKPIDYKANYIIQEDGKRYYNKTFYFKIPINLPSKFVIPKISLPPADQISDPEQEEAKQTPDKLKVQGLTEDEQKMLELVNAERIKAGVPPLKPDLELTKIARLKSKDMIENNYFAHNSPTYGSPFDMLNSFGVSYRYAGENLAGAPDVERAHKALMNSPGHRSNILNPNFTHIGIGIAVGGPYGKMFTQTFIGK
ncbi:MAG: hypothetical protein PWQ82_378 [Thermosediminibacterales bacterium]|nr:hypothetical protein [Thermosediminibacterales bacterium]MDK2836679.1 hypothetical protein [Thermosediminibacterales bacterium]